MVAPARCTVIGEVMDHLSKPQWLGCMTLICPDQFLQSTTGSFLQLLPLPFSVLSDSVSWSTPLISPLYSKVYHLPSCLSKLVKVLRGIPKTQILLIFTPIASLHITLCNLLCTFLPPPVQGVLITKHAHSKECQANLWWWERRHPQKKLRCL